MLRIPQGDIQRVWKGTEAVMYKRVIAENSQLADIHLILVVKKKESQGETEIQQIPLSQGLIIWKS